MSFITLCDEVFSKSIDDYHMKDHVDTPLQNPYEDKHIGHLLYHKNWVDTVQWHLEDIIRNPDIDPVEALQLKRRIDKSNQERTDMVEYLDAYFLNLYSDVVIHDEATLNTESPAWAIDRYSILALKIYHMKEESLRSDATDSHRQGCAQKLQVLLMQKVDLSQAIETLLQDIEAGRKYMKVYKQMKMYNDEELNPVLYKKPG